MSRSLILAQHSGLTPCPGIALIAALLLYVALDSAKSASRKRAAGGAGGRRLDMGCETNSAHEK